MTQPAMPVWLLDIDGVVNALARGPMPRVWPDDAWSQIVVRAEISGTGWMTLPIMTARPVLDFVTRAYHSGRVELRWHSTWRAAAVTDLAPRLGLPPIPISVAPEWTDRPARGWWKLPAAQRVVAAGRPLVWTDDDLVVFAAELGELPDHPDTLLISPDPVTGLQPQDLDLIAGFLGL